MRGLIAALGAVVFIALVPAAQADVQPYATNDAGGFHDVLPPGANGLANGIQLAAFLTTGQRPPHSDDQLAMYRDLMYATPGLKRRGPRALLQGLHLRREARGRRDHRHAARRRHDRARQELRDPPHLRDDARRDDVRRRLRRRAGPPLLHRRAAPPRPRAAVLLHRRRAGQPRHGRRAVVARALHRGRLPAPVRPRRRPLRRPTAASCRTTRSATSPASTSTSPRRGWTRPRCRASTSRSAARRVPTTGR